MKKPAITSLTIQGSSMEPRIKRGDRLDVSSPAANLYPGDIIVFSQRNTLVAHRIIQARTIRGVSTYLTKGDNTTAADGWIGKNDIIGKVTTIHPKQNLHINRYIPLVPRRLRDVIQTYQHHHARWLAAPSISFPKIGMLSVFLLLFVFLSHALDLLLIRNSGMAALLGALFIFSYLAMRYGYFRRLTVVHTAPTHLEIRDHHYPFAREKTARDAFITEKQVTYARLYPYSQAWAMFKELRPLCKGLGPTSALILGFGVGGFACQLLNEFPAIQILGIDIDKKILDVAKKYFLALSPNKGNVTLLQADATRVTHTLQKKFDFIFLDIFDGASLISDINKQKFITSLFSLRKPKGAIVINFGLINQTAMSTTIRTYIARHPDLRLFVMGQNIVGIKTHPSHTHLLDACGFSLT